MRTTKYIQNARNSKGNIITVKSENFPGTHLQKELDKLKITQKQAAVIMGIPPSNVNDIIKGVRPISVLVALRLERAFGLKAAYWINLQVRYYMEMSRLDAGVQRKLKRIKPYTRPPAERS